jgi:hypothetical protein
LKGRIPRQDSSRAEPTRSSELVCTLPRNAIVRWICCGGLHWKAEVASWSFNAC